jgi:hypothetical protein
MNKLGLTPNADGEVLDRRCPRCGYLASEHEVLHKVTIRAGTLTLAEMRAERSTWDVLLCPSGLTQIGGIR